MVPVILCPYVYPDDVEKVRRAFRLDEPGGRRLQFFFWEDKHRVGPDIAYETCWTEFPDRDIIIIHTDMSPLPNDRCNQWYDELLAFAQTMPEAGMLACNLLYPTKSPDGSWLVQSGGGYISAEEIGYIGGGVDAESGTVSDMAQTYNEELKKIRRVAWVTFGGVYIRRSVLAACGPYDRRYHWAYVRDVDYCFEARARGFKLFQVPVTLLHSESYTVRRSKLLTPENMATIHKNHEIFYQKWRSRPDGQELLNEKFDGFSELHGKAHHLSRILDARTKEMERLEAETHHLSRILDARTKEMERLEAEMKGLEAETHHLRQLVSQLNSTADSREREINRLRKNLSAVYASSSWRVTKPIRSIVGAAKRIR